MAKDPNENKEISTSDELTDFLLYTTPQGDVKVEIFLHNETVWLTQKRMADLFGVEVQTINYHLSEVFESHELQPDSTIRKFRIVQNEGGRDVEREINYYNLDAILSVGYRVNSTKATQFRIWATGTLREYIIKGFAIDDNRLKNGQYFGKDYFRELLERVRSIRASERRIYQQITDIFAECSIDYDPQSETTKNFYAAVQNKFHFSIAGKTAAELIEASADAQKPHMGLSTWKNAPSGRIVKSDTTVAKNYLPEAEIKKLERTVMGYFDYIENLIENETTFTMENLAESVNEFLRFNKYQTLEGKGAVSQIQAEKKAHAEYDVFNKTQKIESDFDKFVERAGKLKGE
ncbi:virulence RhuM family protein [Candidatus Peregrinibacteria bacterium]|uniref:Cell filamentation protein Fic n=1 Tax=Candidatus Roizmanbacteria bacterium CG11_big_fil_rev_8_21_14_0_20_36_8 TaxID=1974856 RepID=A0A2M6ITX6_9BACT|nr:virulence RhuM family protein [Candidatus Peregrinibacteria bacterium]PIQ73310.1 MAG: cell filamentation protein Fic [Candidatus Roizmanbacteria bacterium CG11_big_fil_rev_8_21_14_0_20_36_8]